MTSFFGKLILACSPRRRDLLADAGIVPAAIVPADIDETQKRGECPRDLAFRLGAGKASRIATEYPEAFVLFWRGYGRWMRSARFG